MHIFQLIFLLSRFTVGSETGESSKESATISDDVEAAKIFLRKAEEHLLKLEGNVSKFQTELSAQ